MHKVVLVLSMVQMALGGVIADISTGVELTNTLDYDSNTGGSVKIDRRYFVEGYGQAVYQSRADPLYGNITPPTHGNWIANSASSGWIAPKLITQTTWQEFAITDWLYSTSFDLTGYDLSTIRISGRWAADGIGIAVLFPNAIVALPISTLLQTADGAIAGSYTGWTDFNIDGRTCNCFVQGENKMAFVVHNGGHETGLRVEAFLSVVPIPEPATMLMIAGGLVLMARMQRMFSGK